MTPPRSPASDYTEDALIEQPAIELLHELGWTPTNLFKETFGAHGTEGRKNNREVILTRRLLAKLKEFNPNLPDDAYNQAVEELTRDRSAMIPVNANQEFYRLIKEGVRVSVKGEDGSTTFETLKVIDWATPANNDFFLASQFWIQGELYLRRSDLLGFVNGLPLLFIELKASHRAIENAYKDNLRAYRNEIPQLFIPNALIILSNGSETRIGTFTAEWEHFFEWKKISDEEEQGVISLETVLRGVCEPSRFLDIVENFTVFEEVRGGLVKKVAKNHQYLGVNRAIKAVREIENNEGRLGVFWHTQGSGKSLSMVFFTQKILRKIKGNWTFAVVTDRDELDEQIYKTFVTTGAISEAEAQAGSGEHLKQLLQEDHRYIFTLIQKFRTTDGKEYPKLSDRKDIIVITDEAHRSQYDALALNMRNALPNAAFIGFTGTPLIKGEEERTREVFGDYVSVYNFRQSIQDGATVPLYYENRVPELQLVNPQLNEDMEQLLEEAELNEEQEKRLEREFSRDYQIFTRDDRLETVAADVVEHFLGRGYKGKAMMICLDKATAVKMYDKVQKHWQAKLSSFKAQLPNATDEERPRLESLIKEMEEIDMAVVVSQSQNEIEDLQKKGVDIMPHRRRMVNENLDELFKDPDSKFRFVFVCAMWITGFDVPSCSTIYLDKPMRNHTLMQTIARANRVAPGKVAGLIVDYANVFRDLQKALAIYAAPAVGSAGGASDNPIENKQALVDELKTFIADARAYCESKGIDVGAIQRATKFERVKLLDDAVEALIATKEEKKAFLLKANQVVRIYKAILPDKAANEVAHDAVVFGVLVQKIRSLSEPADIADIMREVEGLLDESIATEGYIIKAPVGQDLESAGLVNLSEIDFEALAARFKLSTHKRTEAEKLRGLIEQRLKQLVELNHSRIDYLQKFQKMIDEYNAGSQNIETFFEELKSFAQNLSEEEQRHIREGLTEEELALFDILTKPEPKLSPKEETEVKRVAKELLNTLKREKLVLDWRLKQQARADVEETIKEVFETLPATYTQELYDEKCRLTYQHIRSAYFGAGNSIFNQAA
ncbi:MAG: type restriction enzyme subunit [Acidobacteriota bacterium]|nr:type restriction enzyme subunit [Acidobacteriota bacterium]